MGTMQEIEISRHTNTLLDIYREKYKARYGNEPFIQNQGAAITVMKDLIRASSFERAQAIISTYLRLNGDADWYRRQGHSLECLIKNVVPINAACPSTKPFGRQESQGVRMRWKSICAESTCKAWVDIEGTLEELEARFMKTFCGEHG